MGEEQRYKSFTKESGWCLSVVGEVRALGESGVEMKGSGGGWGERQWCKIFKEVGVRESIQFPQ